MRYERLCQRAIQLSSITADLSTSALLGGTALLALLRKTKV
jgi:hypothetical protein